MSNRLYRRAVGLAALLAAMPATAQDPSAAASAANGQPTVFDDTWVMVGAGVALTSSYDGSDDSVVTPVPLVQGRIGGVRFSPRPAGLALDFIPAGANGVDFNLGVAGKLNRNRASQIKDEVVRAYGELDTAIEVGPSVGVGFNGVLNPYDSLSLGVDVLWDVAGAHEGMTINPSITYFTPVSRGAAVGLSLSARHVDDSYASYYYSVPVAPPAVPAASTLPVFNAEGGFDKAGATLFAGFDFDGDLTNGGLAGVLVGGYSRMLGDAADTPFTSVRGSRDQWLVGVGIGYTF